MRLLHGLAKTHASFDDPHLVSRAGLVPVMALAKRAGLADLVAERVRPGGDCGVSAYLKIPCLVAGMAAGAGSIDDMDLRDCPLATRGGREHSGRGRQPGSGYHLLPARADHLAA